jgi:hypothetical protein
MLPSSVRYHQHIPCVASDQGGFPSRVLLSTNSISEALVAVVFHFVASTKSRPARIMTLVFLRLATLIKVDTAEDCYLGRSEY